MSRGGKLILIKSILEALPVYWMHFWILVGIIEKIRKMCFKFLWSGSCGSKVSLPWTSWKVLANPKSMGGWGLKFPSLFAKSLAAKSVWNIIHGTRLEVQVVIHKYIRPLTVLDWIRDKDKKKSGISICWKSVLWFFNLIGEFLVWKVGNGANVRIGLDPWAGCKW